MVGRIPGVEGLAVGGHRREAESPRAGRCICAHSSSRYRIACRPIRAVGRTRLHARDLVASLVAVTVHLDAAILADPVELTRALVDIESVSGDEAEIADAVEAALRLADHLREVVS